MAIGLVFPFAPSTGSAGYLDGSESELQAVRSDVYALLVTNWGERIMHPTLGCNLIEFCFEQIDQESLKKRISERIKQQLSEWLPFIQLKRLNIQTTEENSDIDENTIDIKAEFSYGNSTFTITTLVP